MSSYLRGAREGRAFAGGREMCLKVVVLAATVALARLLAPAEFWVFVVLSFFNAFLVTFGSFGLAASVVQRREAPTRPELAAVAHATGSCPASCWPCRG